MLVADPLSVPPPIGQHGLPGRTVDLGGTVAFLEFGQGAAERGGRFAAARFSAAGFVRFAVAAAG